MQGLLSFENAPPFAAPLRFFLTAPLFAVLAGLLLAVLGPDALVSRWTPGALALTHLITIGFMLQAMVGALIQVLPVVAGANLQRPILVATIVHLGLTLGTLLLAAGFVLGAPVLIKIAAGLLLLAVLVFLLAGAEALYGVPSTSPTIRGLKLALSGLLGVVGLGAALAMAFAHGWAWPMLLLTDLHAAWGLGAWAGILLASMAYVVVPMFQLTPGYPARPSWWFPITLMLAIILWSQAVLLDWPLVILFSQLLTAAAGIAFAALTLYLQSQRRRAKSDATSRYWQLGLVTSIFALILLSTVALWPDATGQAWTVGFGVLILAGGFVPFICGMLYKIVPFLSWLHLQNLGQMKVAAPPMNKILSDADGMRQMQAYAAAFALLVLAVIWPEPLARVAGLAFALANGWLAWNLAIAYRRFCLHAAVITEKLAAQ